MCQTKSISSEWGPTLWDKLFSSAGSKSATCLFPNFKIIFRRIRVFHKSYLQLLRIKLHLEGYESQCKGTVSLHRRCVTFASLCATLISKTWFVTICKGVVGAEYRQNHGQQTKWEYLCICGISCVYSLVLVLWSGVTFCHQGQGFMGFLIKSSHQDSKQHESIYFGSMCITTEKTRSSST